MAPPRLRELGEIDGTGGGGGGGGATVPAGPGVVFTDGVTLLTDIGLQYDTATLTLNGTDLEIGPGAMTFSGVGAGSFQVNATSQFSVGGVNALFMPGGGSVLAGPTTALAINATTGFLYVPTTSGAPVGVPTVYGGAVNSAITVDDVNDTLNFYSSGAWHTAGGGGGAIAVTDGTNLVDPTTALSFNASHGFEVADMGGGVAAIELLTFDATQAGKVPASGGGTTAFLRADGSWAVPPGTGGPPASPGVVYTDGASFLTDTTFQFDDTTEILTVDGEVWIGTTPNIQLTTALAFFSNIQFQVVSGGLNQINAIGDDNVVIGPLAANATNSTDGFLYVPTTTGAPSGTPTTYIAKSALQVDTGNNLLKFYSSGAWRTAGGGGTISVTDNTTTVAADSMEFDPAFFDVIDNGSGDAEITLIAAPGGGSIWPVQNPPTVSNWTWVNQGGASATDNASGSISLYGPNPGGSTQLRCLVRTLADPDNFDIQMGFVFSPEALASVAACIILRESGTGKMCNGLLQYNTGTQTVASYALNSATSYGGNLWNPADDMFVEKTPWFFRFTRASGGNYFLYYSGDGINWHEAVNFGAVSAFTTEADQYGIAIDAFSGGDGYMTLFYLDVA